MSAMVLISYAVVFGLTLIIPARDRVVQPALKKGALAITFVLCIQLVYGAFMAGLKAANVAPTWPDINGQIIPGSLLTSGSFFYDIVHNKISVHFIHRTMAYVLTIAIFWWWFKTRKISYSPAFNKAKNLTVILVFAQVILGVFSVLTSPGITPGKFGLFEWMAQLHQLTGMLLLLNFVAVLYLSKVKIQPIESTVAQNKKVYA
jgi:cytochrome c oxidase assembly protein subunit 15